MTYDTLNLSLFIGENMVSYKLRPYTKNDFEFVYQAKKNAYKGYVEKFWGSWDENKQRTFFDDFIEKFQDTLSIIEVKGKPIGLYHGNEIDENTYEIGNIIIIPEYQGQGIGKDILSSIMREHSKLKMRLQVFKGNPAINLYHRLNFVTVEETRTHCVMEYKKPEPNHRLHKKLKDVNILLF